MELSQFIYKEKLLHLEILEKNESMQMMCSKLKQSTQIIKDISECKINEEKQWLQRIAKAEEEHASKV